MSLTLLEAPSAEPLSVAECRLQCRIDDNVLDSLIAVYIAAARAQAEFKTRRRFITQRWRQTIDCFPVSGDVRLEVPPVRSVQAVTYVDVAGATQALNSSLWVLDAAVLPGFLLPAYGTSWPATLDAPNAVSIDLTAGYGAADTDVPADLRLWMLMVVGFCVAHPEAVNLNGRAVAIPNRFHDGLLDEHIVYGL